MLGATPMQGYGSITAAAMALRAEGLPTREIAERLGRSRHAISGLVSAAERRRARGPVPDRRRRLTDAQIEQLVQWRERGWSMRQIADRLGVSEGAVLYQSLKHNAVSPRQRVHPVPTEPSVHVGADGRVQRRFTAEEDARMLALEAGGMSYRALARALDRPITSVRIRLMMLAQREEIAG